MYLGTVETTFHKKTNRRDNVPEIEANGQSLSSSGDGNVIYSRITELHHLLGARFTLDYVSGEHAAASRNLGGAEWACYPPVSRKSWHVAACRQIRPDGPSF